MKKYLLLYFGLFFSVGQLSLAMYSDQDESEYNDEYGNENYVGETQQTPYNEFAQNNNVMALQPSLMAVQPGLISQNGIQNNGVMTQPGLVSPNGIQNNGIARQSGFVPQNQMMLNNQIQRIGMNNESMMQSGFVPQNAGQINNKIGVNKSNLLDSTTKQEHVQSLVNNILRINGNTNNGAYGNIAKNGGAVISKSLKNKLLRLQKDLEEINKSLNGVLQNKVKNSSKNKKSNPMKAAASKKPVKRRNRKSKTSRCNKYRDFYTVKQLTSQNSRKYVPNSSNFSGNVYRASPYESGVYKMKSWGTGTASSSASYYPGRSYFSNKSDCTDRCGSE